MNGNNNGGQAALPRPIAFMVMPFRKRAIPNAPKGRPKEVDFDALWDKAILPALEELGYIAIRADFDAGTVIIKDMLERLAFADLVLADLTLQNGNVYYEIGIRHVAKETHCVLISADWSQQLFDVQQMRSLRYPLEDGAVTEATAEQIKKVLIEKLPGVRDSVTPFYELITHREAATTFREHVETISSFQAEVRAARMLASSEAKSKKVASMVECYKGACLGVPEVALELLNLVRDCESWKAMLDFVAQLPEPLQAQPVVKEQTLLAKSKLGDHSNAIAQFEELIKLRGETPERRGLIGGRYKELWRDARKQRQEKGENSPSLREKGYLDKAIESYRRGMDLDLNEYYCACNLPALLAARGAEGDLDEAAFADRLTVKAARLKISRGQDDGWARATLLGAAFRVGIVSEVARLTQEVASEGPAKWQLETTLKDVSHTVEALPSSETKQDLINYRDQLADLMKE